jgi:multiple sugar transport system substrate-binding protein
MAPWTPAIGAWAQAGVLEPLDTRMSGAEHNYFTRGTFPVVHENGWYKKHLYGILVNFDVYACYYRPEMFRSAGLSPDHFPSTMESLLSDAAKLNQYDSSGRLLRVGFLPTAFSNYVGSFGGSFYDSNTSQVLIDTPQNLRALQFIVRTHKNLGFDRILRFNAGLSSQDGANWPFITGQMAITLDGEWRVKQLAQYAPELKYQVAKLPPPQGGVPSASYSATSYLTIPTGAKHAEGAWEFIKFWSGLDNAARGAKYKTWFAWLPDSAQMASAPVYQAFLRQYPQYRTFVDLAASPHITTLPPVPYSVFLQDHILTDDDLAERGALSAAQALSLLQTQVRHEQSQRKALGYDD